MENDKANPEDHAQNTLYDSSGINLSSLGTMGSVTDSYNYDGDLYKSWYVRGFVIAYTLLIGILIPPFGLYMLYGYIKKIRTRN